MEIEAEQEALHEFLCEKAAIIQNSYRAHLWDILMLAAVQHNRYVSFIGYRIISNKNNL